MSNLFPGQHKVEFGGADLSATPDGGVVNFTPTIDFQDYILCEVDPSNLNYTLVQLAPNGNTPLQRAKGGLTFEQLVSGSGVLIIIRHMGGIDKHFFDSSKDEILPLVQVNPLDLIQWINTSDKPFMFREFCANPAYNATRFETILSNGILTRLP